MEVRLENRYKKLVRSHMQIGNEISAGVKNVLTQDSAFNQTQAAWRFFNNKNCTLEKLSQPLLKAAHELSEQECDQYQLIKEIKQSIIATMVEESKGPKKIKPEELISRFRSKEDLYKYLT